jgi:hypothetical protein
MGQQGNKKADHQTGLCDGLPVGLINDFDIIAFFNLAAIIPGACNKTNTINYAKSAVKHAAVNKLVDRNTKGDNTKQSKNKCKFSHRLLSIDECRCFSFNLILQNKSFKRFTLKL